MNIYLKVHGCSNNIAESEMMLGLLKKAGFTIVNTPNETDVIILSICSVKIPSINNALKEIRYFSENCPNKKLIIAGCIPEQLIPEIRELADASLVNTHNITSIVEVVEETVNDNIIEALTYAKELKIGLPRFRKNKVIGIVPISNSCNGFCSFCNTRLIKGDFYSYPEDLIIKEVKKSIKEDCKEIWVTSQDNACYNLEKDKPMLPQLLTKISKQVGDFRIRIGMMNPRNVLLILEELIEAYNSDKVFKFLHLPVQSGSDRILGLMRRGYNVEGFRKIISRFRAKFSHITISTDIIVGFPTETYEEFKQSVELIKEIRADVLNISRFWSHNGTEAAKLEQLHGSETKERSSYLTSIFDYIAFENNLKWKGWEGYILIDEKGKDNSLIGRNFAYKPVIIKECVKEGLELGDWVKVKVNDVTRYDLRAEVITAL